MSDNIIVRPYAESVAPYLTADKVYRSATYNPSGLFSILDDDGDEICCSVHGCAHLNGGYWVILKEGESE